MIYKLNTIVLDTTLHRVTLDGELIHLTNLEFTLLEYLFIHANEVCNREDILNDVWGESFWYDTGTLDVHLHSIRRKLHFTRQYPIEAIRGIGIILHTQQKANFHSLNIRDFAIQWLNDHQEDFIAKQLTPRMHLDPFVSEITISSDNLRNMLDGILKVLLPFSQPGIIHIRSQLTCNYFALSLDINGTINELRIPLH